MGMMTRIRVLFSIAILVASASAIAAPFPEKPVHLVVPFPPGGTTDVVARRISQRVGEILGSSSKTRGAPAARSPR